MWQRTRGRVPRSPEGIYRRRHGAQRNAQPPMGTEGASRRPRCTHRLKPRAGREPPVPQQQAVNGWFVRLRRMAETGKWQVSRELATVYNTTQVRACPRHALPANGNQPPHGGAMSNQEGNQTVKRPRRIRECPHKPRKVVAEEMLRSGGEEGRRGREGKREGQAAFVRHRQMRRTADKA